MWIDWWVKQPSLEAGLVGSRTTLPKKVNSPEPYHNQTLRPICEYLGAIQSQMARISYSYREYYNAWNVLGYDLAHRK